jgi:hypothetical protein
MDFPPYREIWAIDFEFQSLPGERPIPHCLVARELRSGQLVRTWLADEAPVRPPYGTDKDSLFVAYYNSAELGCHLVLGWPMPARILDLYAEFRYILGGLASPCGKGLLGALAYFGLDGIAATEKEDMRQLAIRGGPYTVEEQHALLDYCQTDVDSLARLLPAMLPQIDLPRALLRGRYMAAVARIEWAGVPIDTDTLEQLRDQWHRIKGKLIAVIDADFGVFVPTGQRTINPESVLGSAILSEASEWNIDPYSLADAVDHVWREEREASLEVHEARKAARQKTGLTARRISQWEDAGRDCTTFPGLDVTARELASTYPALGIGQGYTSEYGEDHIDYAATLWDVLRDRTEDTKAKHHPDILRRAAEMVAACPRDGPNYFRLMTFSTQRWADYLVRKAIPWPRLPSGALALDDDTFREMARAYPTEVSPIRELRYTLAQLRLRELTVGVDHRNRCLLSPFSSKTGRNQPSNSKYIFGPSTWLRGLIQPGPGRAVAYVDWSQQELGIAAKLSADRAMQEAYVSGDFYLNFAKMAGAVPAEATKETHKSERDQFKTVALGVLYGLSADGLARKLGVAPCRGRELLRLHQETFRQFWRWSDQIEMEGMLGGQLRSVFGWTVRVGQDVNPRSLRNFPMQANGAEMLRLACCLATERGILVCAPIHDALLVESSADEIDVVIARTQEAMREASELVLPGFPLRTDAKIVRFPGRYMDERGRRMWETVCSLLETGDGPDTPCSGAMGTPCRGATPCSDATPCRDAGGPLAAVHTPSILISLI